MQWIGKAIGGMLGFATAGPVGSVLGLLLGQRYDQASALGDEHGGLITASAETRQAFFDTSFEIMGRIAKADGRVSEAEIRAARRVMRALQLAPEQVSRAIKGFALGKDPDYPLAERLNELRRCFKERHDLARAFVEVQMQAVLGAGAIGSIKRQALWRVASALGVGRVEVAHIEALARAEQLREAAIGPRVAGNLEEAYRSLRISNEASDAEVKRAYRRLMSQHHPDKLVSLRLSDAKLAEAKRRTHEIRAAYERIKAERSFK